MAHYAFLDDNNIVTEVISGRDEHETVNGISDWELHYGTLRNQRCIRTSYNANIRVRYASIGDEYVDSIDAFRPSQPFPSWLFNSESWSWEAPIPQPAPIVSANGIQSMWIWNEEIGNWIETSENMMTMTDEWIE